MSTEPDESKKRKALADGKEQDAKDSVGGEQKEKIDDDDNNNNAKDDGSDDENSDNEDGRDPQEDGENGPPKKKKKKKMPWPSRKEKNKSREIKYHTRKGFEDQQVPNNGSYAHPDMQKLYPDIEIPEAPPEEKNDDPTKNRQKRKVAFLLGYIGTNYCGFQMNENQRTIQAEFELALMKNQFLKYSNFGFPNKSSWSTSGRTDKGVHACAQVCSAKIEYLPDQTFEDIRELLNKSLPEDIRVLDVVRCTRNFCAKTQRDRVRYQYMIPSFLFTDPKKLPEIFANVGYPDNGRQASEPLTREEIEKAQAEFRKVRVTPEQLETLKDALKLYEGTHPFHNFSRRVVAAEERANRYILSFNVEDPIFFGGNEDGIEWIPTQVVGQSFLLNQIRKMVCLAIDVTRGIVPKSIIERALLKESDLRLAQAPAQGLFLEMSYYQSYNKRKQIQNKELLDLDWDTEGTPVFDRWKKFRNGVVMKHVHEEEQREGNFVSYLYSQEFIFQYRKFYGLDDGQMKRYDDERDNKVNDTEE